jgi:uncharacterized protein (DUF2236 family)
VTDAARRVASLFRHPPPEAEWRQVLKAVAFWAFGTLPPRLRDQYGIRWSPAKQIAMRGQLAVLKAGRPLLPAMFREIELARRADRRSGRMPRSLTRS